MAVGVVAVLGLGGWFAFGRKGMPPALSADVLAITDPADPAFFAQVAAAPAERQVELVVQKIESLNPGKLAAQPTITGGVVTGLNLGRQGGSGATAYFRDLSPIAALRGLTQLQLYYLYPGDISFVRGLKLQKIVIHGGEVALDVLRDQPLTEVELRTTSPDYTVLEGKPLTVLDLSSTPVKDISFVKGMPLTRLIVDRTKITDFSPIRGLPLKYVIGDFVPERDGDILREIRTLQTINNTPAAEFLSGAPAK